MNKEFIWALLGNLVNAEPDYVDEPIQPRKKAPTEKLPAPLQAARSLEKGAARMYQNRRSLFLNQAKLLEFYKDDYDGEYLSHCYYPTYDMLTDQELRSYFAWRTKVRNGDIRPSCACFAYLYLYELINGIGTGTPVEGLHKMDAFVAAYREYESSLMHYYANWRRSYIIYYNLSDSFLGEEEARDEIETHLAVLDSAQEQTDAAIVSAVKGLAPNWLDRSKFYKTHQADMDKVIAQVLRRMNRHYSTHSKRKFSEQIYGYKEAYSFELFSCAVFCDPLRHEDGRYYITDSHYYDCRDGYWWETAYRHGSQDRRKLNDLMKAIDASLRAALDDGKPIQAPAQHKWVSKVIEEETAALLEEKKKAEQAAKRVAIDYSALDRIRRDAAITQEKLAVEDEIEEDIPPAPQPEPEPQPEAQPEGCPLDASEYRLMQCLLYGGDKSWVQQEGKMLSVLLDSINEKLYDVFQDSVIEDDRVVEDYLDELKEMVRP